MKPLTIEGCHEVAAVCTYEVVFPLHGVKVTVRKLDLDDCAKVAAVAEGKDENDPGANKTTEVMVCSLAMIDEAGAQTHNSDDGREALALLPDPMRKRISNAALGLIGLDGVTLKNS